MYHYGNSFSTNYTFTNAFNIFIKYIRLRFVLHSLISKKAIIYLLIAFFLCYNFYIIVSKWRYLYVRNIKSNLFVF